MATPRPLRTSMYVPGNKEDWMRKAPQYGADALILDLEDSRRMALASQLVSCRKPCRAPSHNSNPLSGQGGRLSKAIAILIRGVSDELLYRIDANKVFYIVTVTTILTRCRTDTPHHRGERVSISSTDKSIFLPSHVLWWSFHTSHNLQVTSNILP